LEEANADARRTALTVVGEADSVEACLEWTRATQPQVVLFDLALDPDDELSGLWRLRTQAPSAAVLALSESNGDARTLAALQAGARGCLPKTARKPVTGKAGLPTEWFRGRPRTSSRSAIRRRTSRALHERHAEGRPQEPARRGLRLKIMSGGGVGFHRGETENLEEEENPKRGATERRTHLYAEQSLEAARSVSVDTEIIGVAVTSQRQGGNCCGRRSVAACREKPLNGESWTWCG
jgi:CheY-like chemotaxis protein